MTYLSSIYQSEHMASNALQLQILFSAALTMLQQYELAEQLLHDVQTKAEATGDVQNHLAANGILGIVRGFQLRFEESKELVLLVVSGARTGVLYGSDSHRYAICAAARLCKVLGQFEEAEKLYEEAIPLGQEAGNPNTLYHINMVRHLHRLYLRRENFGGSRQLERQYPRAFLTHDVGREHGL
ncbi:hypothetical protein HII31_01894 [Pseudocercospora fuligena]|uniref:MalT-like TPR region domain-containing protein n=1 Tax=Pseudocercospora fuligena TaxID=685502 RepID=A0A8H6RRT4_9PEZI|nr:hypothetical protein HII31_01894 [Pseudocercospora fuligena]